MLTTSRWKRDVGVDELVEHFDQEKYLADCSVLTVVEIRQLAAEIKRCQESFEYAARNYFKIINKQREDQYLTLNEGQDVLLEKIYRLRDRGKPQKLQIIKARQLGAMHPTTNVLTAELNWVRIDSLRPGQKIIGVDEFPAGGRGVGRKFRTAVVLKKWTVQKEAFRITMGNGAILTATGDHPFLCKKRGNVQTEWRLTAEHPKGKKSSSPIRVGDEIRCVIPPWYREQAFEFDDGWFAGLMDGEGSLRAKKNGGIEATVSQVAGPVLNRAARYLDSHGYPFAVDVDKRKKADSTKLGDQPVYKLVLNSIPQVLRLLGNTRPTRFEGRDIWEGKDLPNNGVGQSWQKVVSIESIGEQEMVDIETSTGTFIAEGFITHNCSTLIEALIAWRTMFFPNVAAMVVSHVGTHASFLFQKMVHIYDQLPWWMKPMLASRKEEEGLVFKNPEPELRRVDPGLNSSVIVQAATQVSGVGEGYTINAMHFSEYCSVDDSKAREIIEGDMVHALAPNVGTFAILESTAKGAGRFSEDLWVANVDLAEKADWYTVFLPWFFEKQRVVAPEDGWRPSEPELAMRLRVEKEWVQCTHCGEFRERYFKTFDIKGSECTDCHKGTREPYLLSDPQLAWMQERVLNARRRGPESLKELRQELCTTAEEAFQISGIAVFPEDTQEFVNETICPAVWTGNLDRKGKFHCSIREVDENGKEHFKCFQEWCTVDHRWDLESPLQIWELPEPGARYCIGVDIAEGLATEKSDYSVCWVNKIGDAPSPDTHVATYRSNSINPSDLAAVCNFLGRWYNEAQLSIEYNVYQTTGDNVKNFYQYPNLFRWKHYDSVTGMNSNKLHWLTQQNSKPQLWQTGVRALRERSWFIHDKMFAHEMKRFQKEEYDSKKAEAETNFHDDVIMAALIARYTSHDLDSYDENAYAAADAGPAFVQMLEWTMDCLTCKFTWQANNPEEYRRCPSPKCNSPMLHGKPNTKEGPTKLGGKYVFQQIEEEVNELDTLPEDGTLERNLAPIL